MSLNLLPLRWRCFKLLSRSARTSRPPDILLSLSSNCKNPNRLSFSPLLIAAPENKYMQIYVPTFFSLSSFGISSKVVRRTLMRLSVSRLQNSSVMPSILPSTARQLSRTNSWTWVWLNQQGGWSYTEELRNTSLIFTLSRNIDTKKRRWDIVVFY